MPYQDQDRYDALRAWHQTFRAHLHFPFEAYLAGDVEKSPVMAVALHPHDFKIAIKVPPSGRIAYVDICRLLPVEASTATLISSWVDACEADK